MTIKKWIWQFKYKDVLKKLKTFKAFDYLPSELQRKKRVLECIEQCSNLHWFGDSKVEIQQHMYAMATVFAEGCDHAMHCEFWKEADRLTTPKFWKEYLRYKKGGVGGFPHHRDPDTSYHNADWWSRWPVDMLREIFQHNAPQHPQFSTMADLEREAYLRTTVLKRDSHFNRQWFGAFFNINAHQFEYSFGASNYDPDIVMANTSLRLGINEEWIVQTIIEAMATHHARHGNQMDGKLMHKIVALVRAYNSEYMTFFANFIGVFPDSENINIVAVAQGHYYRFGEYPDLYINELLKKTSHYNHECLKQLTPLVIDKTLDLHQTFAIAWSMRNSYDSHHASVFESLSALESPTV